MVTRPIHKSSGVGAPTHGLSQDTNMSTTCPEAEDVGWRICSSTSECDIGSTQACDCLYASFDRWTSREHDMLEMRDGTLCPWCHGVRVDGTRGGRLLDELKQSEMQHTAGLT